MRFSSSRRTGIPAVLVERTIITPSACVTTEASGRSLTRTLRRCQSVPRSTCSFPRRVRDRRLCSHGYSGQQLLATYTMIDNALTNDNPNAIVVVTPNYNPGGVGGTYDNHPIGVWYDGSKWAIFNQDITAYAGQCRVQCLRIRQLQTLPAAGYPLNIGIGKKKLAEQVKKRLFSQFLPFIPSPIFGLRSVAQHPVGYVPVRVCRRLRGRGLSPRHGG